MSISFNQKDKLVLAKPAKKAGLTRLDLTRILGESQIRRLGSPSIKALRIKSGKFLKPIKLKKGSCKNVVNKAKFHKSQFRVKSRAIKNIHKVDLNNYKSKKAAPKKRTNSRILCRDERILDKCELIHRKLLEKLSTKMELSKYCNGRFFSPQCLQRKIMSPMNMNRALRSPKAHKFQATKYLPELSIQSI
ncbi:unnamed protein product [Moneuplotes crassus]|uniref:Uncharacterized protein n=1 Tax=Euplotes crassus TaxID=5936 RepID=A0AAD2D4U6_EUPCR|nr:unnamed protein product [Moneuplotes crassus]